MNRKVSSLVFLVIIIMFSFPWVVISDYFWGQSISTSTGFQALSGYYPCNHASMMGEAGGEPLTCHPNFWLILAIIVAVIGVITGLMNGSKIIDKALVWLSSIESALLVIFPLLLHDMIQSCIKSLGEGIEPMFKVSFRPAFYIALFLSIGCIFLNSFFKGATKAEKGGGKNSEAATGKKNIGLITNNIASHDYVFCPNCGAKNPRGNKFCRNCGAKLS